MANITLNIEGNLNIFLDGRDDAPCRMYLDNDNDTVEFQSMMIHCGDPIRYASIDTNYWRKHFLQFGRLPNP